jgi:hypothetical protein
VERAKMLKLRELRLAAEAKASSARFAHNPKWEPRLALIKHSHGAQPAAP